MKKFLLLSLIFVSFVLFACDREIVKKEKEARTYFDKKQFSKVIEMIEPIKPSRRGPRLSLILGKSYGELMEFNKANLIFNTIAKRYPSYKDSLITVYLLLAKKFEKRKRNDIAVKSYNAILSLEGEYNIGDGFYTMGHYYYALNNVEKAREFFEKGIENITNANILKKARSELMSLYESLGMYKKAVDVSDGDSSTDILYKKGEIEYKLAKELFSRESFDSALVYCQDIIVINTPKTLIDDAYFLSGEIYSSIGDYKSALASYKKVIRLDMYRNTPIASLAKERIKALNAD